MNWTLYKKFQNFKKAFFHRPDLYAEFAKVLQQRQRKKIQTELNAERIVRDALEKARQQSKQPEVKQ